ncbi:TPR-like protein [Aspergillus steynii IBT 23096]|uniref:TPR-like protein n=1 Tax=Aspergillus steynii IBT 23096 TaxID=1392250 RepID=A0A2I2G042_9EURO|nr:TPR-like protein [Aspergillus steynii IBT 23096]PLB46258.1 TPR-like protein [Aspergillus steynii IBT 23096]
MGLGFIQTGLRDVKTVDRMTTFADNQLSPLWEKALENYRDELAADDDFRTILETKSLDELLNDPKILQPFGPQGRKALDSMNRLRPTFKIVNDFSAVLAVSFGAGTMLTALVWGSIRMILTLASSAENTLQEVFDMLEELSLTLPRLKFYEKTVSMDQELEASLLAVYTEVICFYARAIHFFRSHKHMVLLRNSWSEFSGDFSKTVQRIKRLSATIESEVELRRMRLDNEKYHEVLNLMATFHTKRTEPTATIRHYIPFSESPRFWGRDDILSKIDGAFSSSKQTDSLRSFALYGMGGVGKTQIALRYANSSRDKFDAIFWVAADNLITIGQSFREIARSLSLIQSNTETDDNAVMLEVKSWLSSTKSRWLLIFDNADDLGVLKQPWPSSTNGCILLTSRDLTAAFSLASEGCQVTPFDTASGSAALLNIVGLDPSTASNLETAETITSTLGGLPLALTQIGGFIVQRRIPLKDFLPLYNRSSARVDARGTVNMNYNHTLATVWEMSLSRLSGDAKALLMILAFTDPDCVQESLLTEGALHVPNPLLQFAEDEIALLDAEDVLLQGALIDKTNDGGIMSMHRLIQTAVIRRMNSVERQEIFSILVAVLLVNFPDTYSADVGHQAASWASCEKSLPHLQSLIKQNEAHCIFLKDNQAFAELLLRSSWYLYERENYSVAQSYVKISLGMFSDHKSLAYASAVDLQGLIHLDIRQPNVALEAFEEAYKLRSEILETQNVFLAASLVNIGLALTEIGRLSEAHDYLQRSIDIRLEHNSDRIGNSYSNMASLLLRMEKADEAEEMLKRCPSLKDFTDETFLKTGNPRFSGDMVLLGRIRSKQGLHNEALRFASKALDFRRQCLGERLKVCDSLYQVADLLQRGGQSALAIQLYEECIKISEALPPIEGLRHLARAKHGLSVVLETVGKRKESEQYAEQAKALKKEVLNDDTNQSFGPDTEPDFEDLVPWMLW